MDMTVRVRQARLDEAEALAALHLRVALHAYAHIFPAEAPAPTLDAVTSQWREWLDARDARVGLVAESNGVTVGVATAGPDPAQHDVGHLARLYVDAPRWGRGIGRRLHDEAIAHLVSSGFTSATLWVLERNDRARTWYERLGWVPTGARKAVWAPAGIEDVGYRRELPAT